MVVLNYIKNAPAGRSQHHNRSATHIRHYMTKNDKFILVTEKINTNSFNYQKIGKDDGNNAFRYCKADEDGALDEEWQEIEKKVGKELRTIREKIPSSHGIHKIFEYKYLIKYCLMSLFRFPALKKYICSNSRNIFGLTYKDLVNNNLKNILDLYNKECMINGQKYVNGFIVICKDDIFPLSDAPVLYAPENHNIPHIMIMSLDPKTLLILSKDIDAGNIEKVYYGDEPILHEIIKNYPRQIVQSSYLIRNRSINNEDACGFILLPQGTSSLEYLKKLIGKS